VICNAIVTTINTAKTNYEGTQHQFSLGQKTKKVASGKSMNVRPLATDSIR